MTEIWKTPEAGKAVRARYAQFLAHWPAANEQLRLPEAGHFLIGHGTAIDAFLAEALLP